MNVERRHIPIAAHPRRRKSFLHGIVLAALALTACSPPATDTNEVEQHPPAVETAGEDTTQVSRLDALLARLGEPPLADNCAADITSYRVSRLVWEEGAAAVRVFSGPDGRGYRSVFSPALGEAISSDGWLDERRWNRVVSEFEISDFWNIASDEFADDNFSHSPLSVMFLEACRDGVYHYLESDPRHHWLDDIVDLLSRIGKLQWLATGRRDFS